MPADVLDYRKPEVRMPRRLGMADVWAAGAVIVLTAMVCVATVTTDWLCVIGPSPLVLPLLAVGATVWIVIVVCRRPSGYRHLRVRIALVAACAAVPVFFWVGDGFERLRDLKLRLNVAAVPGGRASVVNWARSALGPSQIPTVYRRNALGHPISLASLPPRYRRLGTAWYERDSRGIWYIDIGGSGKMRHPWEEYYLWGIIVGPPGYVPEPMYCFMVRWEDGVWGYQVP